MRFIRVRWLRPCLLYTPPVAPTDWMLRWISGRPLLELRGTGSVDERLWTFSFRGRRSRNKVSVGEPAEGSLGDRPVVGLSGNPGGVTHSGNWHQGRGRIRVEQSMRVFQQPWYCSISRVRISFLTETVPYATNPVLHPYVISSASNFFLRKPQVILNSLTRFIGFVIRILKYGVETDNWSGVLRL